MKMARDRVIRSFRIRPIKEVIMFMMFMRRRSFGVHAIGTFAILAAVALAPRVASADGDGGDDMQAARAGITLGGRAMYYQPKDAQDGTLNGGAQLRLHFTSMLAVEGSADYRQNKFGGNTVDVVPVQLSLMLYLAPSWVVSPYILGGVGWYYTHVQGGGTTNRYGPHAGAGLELALAKNWSIDGSARYLWTQSLSAPTTASPAGKNFSDNGFMLTAALNYRF
jgi:opacity protein-like surface antigen